MAKRLVAILMSLMLLIGLFAGCQSETKTDDSASSSTSSSTSTEKKEETKKEETKKEEAKEEVPAAEDSEHVELSFVWTNFNEKSAEDEEVFAWVNEKFNCDFEWISLAGDVRAEKLGVMWASGDKFTASFGLTGTSNAQCLQVQYDNGWIWPLDDFIDDLPTISADIVDLCWAYTTMDDGLRYGIPEQGCEVKTGMWVRQDWLEAVGLEIPTTIAEMEVVMDAFRNNDPDGDGQQDTYGAVVRGSNFKAYEDYIISAFLPYGNSWQPIAEGDEKLYPLFMHPDYKNYLATMASWYEKGYVHPNQVMMNGTTSTAAFSQGEVGLNFSWYGDGDAGISNLLAAFPDANPIMVSSPAGENGQGGAMAKNLYGGSIVFNKKASEAEVRRFLEILDYYCTEEGNAVRNYGIPGVQWEDNGDTVKVPDGKENVYRSYCRLPGGTYAKYWRPLEGGVECVNDATVNCYQGNLDFVYAYDYMFPYNWAGTQSESKISDLDKLITTYIEAVCSGVESVDYIDEGIEAWLAAGGETYIEEYNAQYNELKPIYG